MIAGARWSLNLKSKEFLTEYHERSKTLADESASVVRVSEVASICISSLEYGWYLAEDWVR
jgi:hypothetical protein